MANRFPTTNYMAIIVEEVDSPNRQVHVRDKFGGKLIVSYQGNSLTSVPGLGEAWIISRNELNWTFVQRVEDGIGSDRIPSEDLVAGDTKLRAAATLHIDAGLVQMNGYNWGVTIWEKFSLLADANTLTLIETPLDIRSVQVHNNRSLVDPTGITMSDTNRTLTFSPALSAGTAIIYYQYTPTAIKVDDLLS